MFVFSIRGQAFEDTRYVLCDSQTLGHRDFEFCISVDDNFVHELKGVRSHIHCVREWVRACQSDAGDLLSPLFPNEFYLHSASTNDSTIPTNTVRRILCLYVTFCSGSTSLSIKYVIDNPTLSSAGP